MENYNDSIIYDVNNALNANILSKQNLWEDKIVEQCKIMSFNNGSVQYIIKWHGQDCCIIPRRLSNQSENFEKTLKVCLSWITELLIKLSNGQNLQKYGDLFRVHVYSPFPLSEQSIKHEGFDAFGYSLPKLSQNVNFTPTNGLVSNVSGYQYYQIPLQFNELNQCINKQIIISQGTISSTMQGYIMNANQPLQQPFWQGQNFNFNWAQR